MRESQGLKADMDRTLDGMQHKAVKLPRVVTVAVDQADCPDTEISHKARHSRRGSAVFS